MFAEDPWTSAHTAAAMQVGVMWVGLAVAVIVVAGRRVRDGSPVDRAAPYVWGLEGRSRRHCRRRCESGTLARGSRASPSASPSATQSPVG
jgi:hypothetical protein